MQTHFHPQPNPSPNTPNERKTATKEECRTTRCDKNEKNPQHLNLYGTLSLALERIREPPNVVGELALRPEELHVCAVLEKLTGIALDDVLFAAERGEAPVLGHDDLLATGEPVEKELYVRVDLGYEDFYLGGRTCTEIFGKPQWRWHGGSHGCGRTE